MRELEIILLTLLSSLLLFVFIWLALQLMRWAKKGTKGNAVLTAIMFPYPDQPPPHEQVEENLRKSNAESGTPPL